jgi:hypothetical protein
VDLSKLTTSDKVVAGSGLALFIFSFFPWYGVEGFDGGRNGWDYFLFGIIPVLLGLAMLAVVAIKAFSSDTKLPDLPVPWGQAMLIAGVIAAVLVLLKLLMGDDVLGFDLDRKFGLILSAISAIGLAAGGYLKFQEGDDAPSTGGGSGSAPF